MSTGQYFTRHNMFVIIYFKIQFYRFSLTQSIGFSLFLLPFCTWIIAKLCFISMIQEKDLMVIMASASMTWVVNHSVQMQAFKAVIKCRTVSGAGCRTVYSREKLTFSQQGGKENMVLATCLLTIWLHETHLEVDGNHFCLKGTFTLMEYRKLSLRLDSEAYLYKSTLKRIHD